MNILILEDEIPAYQKIVSYLNAYYNNNIEHDWARSIKDASPLLTEGTYDFILSDIQLLDGISFDLFDDILINCPIIFCSAHDDYLFKAFNTNGIAYILKPYSKSDFIKAIEKYEALFKKGDYNTLNHQTLTQLKQVLKEEQSSYKKRFVIKKAKGIQLLSVNTISYIKASGDFCTILDASGKQYSISQSFGDLLKQLNPKKFFKINRSEIVCIDYIENIENHFKNRLLITITGCFEKPMTSSSSTADFRKWLEQ